MLHFEEISGSSGINQAPDVRIVIHGGEKRWALKCFQVEAHADSGERLFHCGHVGYRKSMVDRVYLVIVSGMSLTCAESGSTFADVEYCLVVDNLVQN